MLSLGQQSLYFSLLAAGLAFAMDTLREPLAYFEIFLKPYRSSCTDFFSCSTSGCKEP